MKTLYITDLDGTLLDANVEVSQFTVDTLNQLIEGGMNFSVATARTSETIPIILRNVNINLPVIIMNGVAVYDLANKSFLQKHPINNDSLVRFFDILRRNNSTGFLYVLEDNIFKTYYEEVTSEHAKAFIEERIRKYNKKFTKVDSFEECINNPDSEALYFSVCDWHDNIKPVYDLIRTDPFLNVEFYRDIYDVDHWYLEISSHKASKFSAINYLRNTYGFDKIISFGDNLNDIPMFKASDKSYAVSNANPEVKAFCSAVIESNLDDGVARWLINNYVG
jgi:Cof subfamily protein (haloacid dehalogenase superfamily)